MTAGCTNKIQGMPVEMKRSRRCKRDNNEGILANVHKAPDSVLVSQLEREMQVEDVYTCYTVMEGP